MLYVHKLSDLNPSTANIECIEFIRELRRTLSLPVSADRLVSYLSASNVVEDDLKVMETGLSSVEPAVAKLSSLLSYNDGVYEPVNIYRAMQTLSQVPSSLKVNIDFGREIVGFQSELAPAVASLLNAVPSLRTLDDKSRADAFLSALFARVLRNSEFSFRFSDVIHEGQLTLVSGLLDSLSKGFLFHFTLEDEIKKLNFEQVKPGIPSSHLSDADEARSLISAVNEGVVRAYSVNMRMVTLAVMLFSAMKWALSVAKEQSLVM